MGYLYITIASILFSSQFAFTKQFQRHAGKGLQAAFLSYAVGPIAFILITLCTEGFDVQVTPFSLIFSAYTVLSTFLMGYFGIQALAAGSLSNYSIFMMSGGMILPCLYGVIWGNDTFGIFKILGILLILSSVLVKVNLKEKASLKTYVYLTVLFILNGMAGVVASIYQSDIFPYARPTATQYALGNSLFTLIFGWIACAICFFVNDNRKKKELGKESAALERKQLLGGYVKAAPWSMGSGLLNSFGNLLLLFALETLQPSLQYPIIKGGSILLSAVIGFIFFKEKPDKRTWLAVALAVVGTIVIIF